MGRNVETEIETNYSVITGGWVVRLVDMKLLVAVRVIR